MLSFQRQCRLSLADVRHWFMSPAGAQLLQAGNRLLEERLASCFGSYLLEYNPLAAAPAAAGIRHQIRLGEGADGHDIQCQACLWPVQPDGVDVVVLRHSLEFAHSPYDLLREAARAVRPGGHLLVTGLNPYSLPGLATRFSRTPWRQGRRLSAARIAEWLAVLGLTCEPPRFARVPLCRWQTQTAAVSHSALHPGHAGYLLVARKQVHVSLRRPAGLKLPELLPVPVVRQGVNNDVFDSREHHD